MNSGITVEWDNVDFFDKDLYINFSSKNYILIFCRKKNRYDLTVSKVLTSLTCKSQDYYVPISTYAYIA